VARRVRVFFKKYVEGGWEGKGVYFFLKIFLQGVEWLRKGRRLIFFYKYIMGERGASG
jgi:hypothetical protein